MASVARDYSLDGPETQRAIERGLAEAQWFQAEIDPARLRELSVRSNARAGIDALVWFALAIGLGILAWNLRGTWWAVPAFAAYGAVAGGSSDARWHECGHGTAFRTGWLNDLVYYPASFMLAREARVWRWSHFRHHTDTIIVGRDAEIIFPRPPSVLKALMAYTHVTAGPALMARTVRHAFGKLESTTEILVPESEHRRLIWEARVYSSVWATALVWAVATTSIYPLLLIGGPTIYGAWLVVFFGITQHAGLQEDVLDHRYSTRTVLMNPVFRFLYLNMNYHVEHHMFPSVPYYRLPQLHAEIADQLPEPLPNTIAAYRQIFHAIRHQQEDPTWELDRDVPDVPGRVGPIVQSFDWPAIDGATNPGGINIGGINIGKVALQPGESQPMVVQGASLLLACSDEGELFAVERICTHGEADLADGTIRGCEIECPKHLGRFDLRTGAPAHRPVSVPLRTWRVTRRADGAVLISDHEGNL